MSKRVMLFGLAATSVAAAIPSLCEADAIIKLAHCCMVSRR